MSAAADKRGLKRVCVDCGIRFYDMKKRPIICPNCSTEFTGAIKVKSRRGRVAKALEEGAESQVAEAAAKKKAVNDDFDEDEIEEADEIEVVSLDDEDVERDDADVDGDDEAIIVLDDEDDLTDLGEDDLGDLEDLDEEDVEVVEDEEDKA